MRGALFQRKSRAGWLEELDGIREDALKSPEGPEGDTDDIWTDLRDGGEYADPHEISSLYATDETPDLPVTHKGQGKGASRSGRARQGHGHEAGVTVEHHEVAAALPPPPPPAPPAPQVEPPVEPAAAATMPDDPWAPNVDASATHPDTDQIWVQPAPHPIRPSEMWHPAELVPTPLNGQAGAPAEERVDSADLFEHDDPAAAFGRYRPVDVEPAAEFAEAPGDDRVAAQLEAELVAAADMAVLDQAPPPLATPAASFEGIAHVAPPSFADAQPIDVEAGDGGLISGPVGRRVRRDRPRATLPDQADLGASPTAPLEDVSPLPVAPLPPAALPTRANRMPAFEELPATPSSVLPPAPAPVLSPIPEPVAVTPEPVAVAPVPVAEPEPVAAAPEPVALPTPVAEPEPVAVVEDVPISLQISATGMVPVPGTIVRLGGAQIAAATTSNLGCAVDLQEGWCWVAPGDGAGEALHIELPAGLLHIAGGSTVLAVSETDRSAFVIVAVGGATFYRGSDERALAEGSICMIDASGGVQVDLASVAEIEGDPIVAENLSLDAEL